MDDGIEWVIPQDPRFSPLADPQNKEQRIGTWRGFLSRVPDGARYTIIGLTAECDRMAAEAEGMADTPAGLFNNRYHFLFVIKDGEDRGGEGVRGQPLPEQVCRTGCWWSRMILLFRGVQIPEPP